MIRKIGLLGLLLTLSVWLCSAVLLNKLPLIDLKLAIPQVIINTGNKPIKLYSELSDDTLGWLDVGDSLAYMYSGNLGDWHYGSYQNRTVSIRDASISVGFLLQGYPVPENVIVKAHRYLPYLALFFVVLLVVKKYKKNTKSEGDAVFHDRRAEDKQLAYAQNQIIQLKQQLKTKDRQLEQSETQRLQQQLEKKAEWDAILAKLSEEESRSRDKDVKLSDLQNSYDHLNAEFNKIVEEARIFDFPYQNKKYENILKGRKYELRVARSLHNQGYTFLEWTPDKGFEEGIYVKSNNNPDLVVAKNSHVIAIECKYRSKYFMKRVRKYRDEISWASILSANFYAEFSERRNLPVFLALGFKGNPESPDNEYLIPLDIATSLSSDRIFDTPVDGEMKTKRQKTFRESEIMPYLNSSYQVDLRN